MRCQGSGAGSIQLLNGVDRRFSLYSTDTEERLISVDKGLDRCTAMLRSLLQIEDPVPGGRQLPMSKEKTTFTSRKGRTFRDKPTKQLGSMKEENRLQANPDHKKKWEHGPSKLQDKSADCNPLVVHPEACSTPDGKGGARHTAERAKERQKISALQSAPAVIVRQEHTVAPSHIRRAETKVNQKVDLSTNKTCRRLESDQRQTPSTARDAIPSLARKANDCGPQRNILWIGKDKKMVTKTEKNSADRPVAPLHHQQQASVACGDGSSPPPPPPPLFNPFYYPYGFPYLPPYPYPYFHHPHFHHPQSWTPYKHSSGTKRHQVVPHKADVMEALDLASIHYQPLHRHHRSREEPLDYYHWYFDHRYHQHLSSPKCSTHDKQSGVVEEKQDPPPPMEPATIATNGTGTEITVKSVPVLACEEISDLEGLGGLVKILMSSCEETVQNMKMACGEEPVMVRLTELQVVLSQMRQRLCEQCQRMSLKHKQEQLSKMSVADWLGQVQLCEDEKAGLIERIKESCGAYSKVRKKLDDLQEEKQMQDRELEEKKKQVSSLQEELGKASGSVRQMAAKLKLKHEELVHVKGCSHSSGKELQAQNTAFQEQLSSLKVEVREGTEQQLGLMRELSHVRQVLDANKAEQQMLQVTMQGKSTQLLETQDKLLGLRQCLACFLSGLSRTGTVEQEQGVATRGHFLQYVVPVQVVEKLKLLADDGNIESFLASYSQVADQKMTWSPDSKRDFLFGTVTEEEDERRRGWDNSSMGSTSSQSNNVITPLGSMIRNSDNECSTTTPTQHRHSICTPLNCGKHQSQSSKGVAGSSTRSIPRTKTSEIVPTEAPRQRGQYMHTPKTVLTKKYNRKMQQFPPVATSPSSQSGSLEHPSLLDSSMSSFTDVRSSMTTNSELDFRKDLASLDSDIARLQVQFKVALQPPN